jgi:beta-galactosidase/beta-glucuronidase
LTGSFSSATARTRPAISDSATGQGDFAKTGDFKFAKAGFDDSKWRTLSLPHDWAVELPFVRDEALNSHGFKPLGRRYPETSVGWYRREFEIPASDEGRRITVEFDGAFRSVLVFVNGCFIGRNDNGYAPFSFDLTDFLIYGAKNYIVARVDASFGDGWFYEGAGIYRHVWLTKTDALHLGQWESWVRTELKGNSATLTLRHGGRERRQAGGERQSQLADSRRRGQDGGYGRGARAIDSGGWDGKLHRSQAGQSGVVVGG